WQRRGMQQLEDTVAAIREVTDQTPRLMYQCCNPVHVGSPMRTKAAQYRGWANGPAPGVDGSAPGGSSFSGSAPLPRATPLVISAVSLAASSALSPRSHAFASARASAFGSFRVIMLA